MKPLILALFINLFLHVNAYSQNRAFSNAETCSYVNLAEPNQIFADIPVYDQGGGQICFAYSAVQIIEGQRALQGEKYNPASAMAPLSLALSIAIAKGAQDLQQGGVACEAVEHARKNPICPASKSFKTADEIEKLITEFKNCKDSKDNTICNAQIEKLKLDKDLMNQDNPLLYVKGIENSKCSDADKIKLNIPPCVYDNDESLSSTYFKKKVDAVFSSKSPRPVEVGYSMNLFSYDGVEKKKYVMTRVREMDVLQFSLRYKPHSSILLGRKMGKNGQCQYLLRNTQGASFCPQGIVTKFGWECDTKSGGIWINKTELFDSIFQVSNIDKSLDMESLIQEIMNLNKDEMPKNCVN